MQPTQTVRDAGLDAVIGMYPTVHRVRTTVVHPWTSSLAGDAAVRPPRSVLLYGPEGCGVTYLAGRLADELGSIGAPAVVVGHVDDLAAAGPERLVEALASPAFADVVVVGVSHRPWDVPLDEGGFERLALVPPPDWDARRFRLWESAVGRGRDVADLDRLVVATERWSGADLASLAEHAGLPTDELLDLIAATTPSSVRWLEEAGDMVRRRGHGRFDDLTGYLQRYRML